MIFIADDVLGRHVSDSRGRAIGRVTAFYRYPTDLQAPWGVAAVTRGKVFKKPAHLVDLCEAQINDDGLVVSYPGEKIEAAPHYRPLIGDTLEHDHAVEVLDHYRGTGRPA
jgi:hypothetical protein